MLRRHRRGRRGPRSQPKRRRTADGKTSRSKRCTSAPNRSRHRNARRTRPIKSRRPPRSKRRRPMSPPWPRSRSARRRRSGGRRRSPPKRNPRRPTMRRAELVQQLNSEQAAWEDLLGEIGEDRMEEPGVAGTWSIKDIVAHLTAWRRRTVARLETVARGQPEPRTEWPADLHDDDEINAWFHARDRDKSVRETLAESRGVFERLVSAIEKLPEDSLDDPARFPWMQGAPLTGATFFGHFHDEHEADMRAYLSRQPTRS
ncbi:MAG: ClbS/DfsB family four-helix bundle protein [Chloroflexi bacterium]|nr:MAG: ClbS/DfsB family four-helix bundle protein [Chloroflexota bacterium]